jgi:hypothetical protein
MASKRKVLTLDERIKVIELCKTKSALICACLLNKFIFIINDSII